MSRLSATRTTSPTDPAIAPPDDLETLFEATPEALLDRALDVRTPTTHLHIGAGAITRLTTTDPPGPTLIIATPRALAHAPPLPPEATLFTTFTPNPTPAEVDAATTALRTTRATTLIAIGGGSTLDLAKAAAWHTRTDGRRTVRLILAPTTAGSGAEVTPFASIWPPDQPKFSIDDPQVLPDIALIDWHLTTPMPPTLTAIGGLDALVHAFETTIGVNATPPARRHAARALTLIGHHLLPAITHPTPTHRAALALAATHAGLGLATSRSAAAHALSYTLTARFAVPHGLAVGLLACALMPLQRRLAPAACQAAETALGQPIDTFITAATTRAALPTTLTPFGVTHHHLDAIAQDAARSIRLANNPGPPTLTDLITALQTTLP